MSFLIILSAASRAALFISSIGPAAKPDMFDARDAARSRHPGTRNQRERVRQRPSGAIRRISFKFPAWPFHAQRSTSNAQRPIQIIERWALDVGVVFLNERKKRLRPFVIATFAMTIDAKLRRVPFQPVDFTSREDKAH